MDVTEDANNYKIHADLPGMRMEDIDLSIEKDILTIKGHREREHKEEDKDGRVKRMERSYGSYSRSIKLPKNADQSNPTATFTNGVLEITIPKKVVEELPQKQRIQITQHASN